MEKIDFLQGLVWEISSTNIDLSGIGKKWRAEHLQFHVRQEKIEGWSGVRLVYRQKYAISSDKTFVSMGLKPA